MCKGPRITTTTIFKLVFHFKVVLFIPSLYDIVEEETHYFSSVY
jgi:hypothetical protein